MLLEVNDKDKYSDKINYIINNCKCLCDKDLDCIIKLIDYLKKDNKNSNMKG